MSPIPINETKIDQTKQFNKNSALTRGVARHSGCGGVRDGLGGVGHGVVVIARLAPVDIEDGRLAGRARAARGLQGDTPALAVPAHRQTASAVAQHRPALAWVRTVIMTIDLDSIFQC